MVTGPIRLLSASICETLADKGTIMRLLNNEKGAALLIALSLLILLSLLAISAADRSQTDIEMSYNQLHEEQAFYLAEAGVNQAVAALNEDNSWRVGYNDVTLGKGTYSVTMIDSSTDSTLDDSVLLRSEGFVDGSYSIIELTTVPEYRSLFQQGLFADAGISMARNTCTDSYNADSGSYAATVVDSLGSIGSNGTINSAKDVVFGGDVSVATEGGLSFGPFNTINGDTTSTADSVDLDLIPDSEYDWAKSVSSAPGGISGSGYTYDPITNSLTTGSFANIELSSGVYYFSDMTFGQGTVFSLAPGAEVTIYVTGDITLAQSSTMNSGGNPADLLIYSSGSSLLFNQDNVFVGSFYGPNADIQYDQTTQAYGSLVGSSIQMDKGACFHYDRHLTDLVMRATGKYLGVAWEEVI